MKKLIRIALIVVMALILLGSSSTSVQADPGTLNVDYVGLKSQIGPLSLEP